MSPYNQFIQMSFLPFIWTNGGISCYGKLLTFYMMSKGLFHKVYFDNKIWTTKDERKGRGNSINLIRTYEKKYKQRKGDIYS